MNEVPVAFDVIRTAMIKDEPSKQGSYAHSWHCNIAMSCLDAMTDDYELAAFDRDRLHRVANDAATRFMKLCFGVDTVA